MNKDGENQVLDFDVDFGKKGMQVHKEIKVNFSTDASKHKLNPQINKQYANLFSQAEEISEQTIKNDASATQKNSRQ